MPDERSQKERRGDGGEAEGHRETSEDSDQGRPQIPRSQGDQDCRAECHSQEIEGIERRPGLTEERTSQDQRPRNAGTEAAPLRDLDEPKRCDESGNDVQLGKQLNVNEVRESNTREGEEPGSSRCCGNG